MARYGNNHKGGRPSKAEAMGLDKKMAKAFNALSKGNTSKDGSVEVLKQIFSIAMDPEHPKQVEMLKWVSERYFGKEPKAIHQEITLEGGLDYGNVKDIFGGVFEDEQDDEDKTK